MFRCGKAAWRHHQLLVVAHRRSIVVVEIAVVGARMRAEADVASWESGDTVRVCLAAVSWGHRSRIRGKTCRSLQILVTPTSGVNFSLPLSSRNAFDIVEPRPSLLPDSSLDISLHIKQTSLFSFTSEELHVWLVRDFYHAYIMQQQKAAKIKMFVFRVKIDKVGGRKKSRIVFLT